MQIELNEEKTYTVRHGEKLIYGMYLIDSWEGMAKLENAAGLSLIVNDGKIIKGSPELLASLDLMNWLTQP